LKFIAENYFSGTVNDSAAWYIPPQTAVDKKSENAAPIAFTLSQNYPNPFNPLTTIQFSLATQSQVSLVVYDVNGKQVASLVNETKKAGRHTITFDGSHLTSGIYFYNLHYKEGVLTRKMTLVK